MVKKSLLWLYKLTLWLVGLIVTIVVITALSIQFWLMPNIDHYKDDIAKFASQLTSQKIVIGNIQADWQGINPHLSLDNVDIFDAEGRIALQLNNIETAFSWLSIPMLEPHLAEITVHKPALTIRRNTDGEIFIAGISTSGDSKPQLANWLLRQSRLGVSNAKVIWIDELRSAPELSLNQLNIEIFSPPWKSLIRNHGFIITTIPSVGTTEPIRITGSFYGKDVSKTEQWRGNASLQLKNADLAAFRSWLDYPLDLRTGLGSTDLNIDFADNQLQSLNSQVSLKNLQLLMQANTAPLILNTLDGNITWKNLNKVELKQLKSIHFGQKLSIQALSANTSQGLNIKDLSADFTQTTDGEQVINANLASFDLNNIESHLALLPVSEDLLHQIKAIKPKGKLENLKLNWTTRSKTATHYEIESDFKNLSIHAHNKLPGFSNLSGTLKADENKGKLALNTSNAQLDFAEILRWPVPADKLNGKVIWSTANQQTKINVNALEIANPHLSGIIDASYTLDHIKGGYLDLNGKFNNGNAKYAPYYYPTILGETTLRWLDTSILAGHASDINLTIKGRLDDFPFVDSKNNPDPAKGLFRVTAKISDSVLEYGTGWPKIEKLDLNMLFEGKRMELNTTSGRIFGNQILNSKTSIAQLDADYPILDIEAVVTGPVNEGVNFVNRSPVLEVTQGFTENLKTSGSGRLNLSLKIPLDDLDASKFQGKYQISNGKMESDSIPTLTQINGALEFTESSLSAKAIKALAFNSPLTLGISTAKDKSIRVTAKGKLSDESIKQLLREQNLTKASNYVNGSANWVGDILIQKPRVNISIRSDLVGVTSLLPAPLNKHPDQALTLRVDKKQNVNTDHTYINLGNKVIARVSSGVSSGKPSFKAAHIHISSSANLLDSNTELTDANKGLTLTGNIDYLNADAWLHVIKEINSNNPTQRNNLSIQKIALDVKALDFYNRRINQLNISELITSQDSVQAQIKSQEITGFLQWKNSEKLVARLSNLTIPETAPDQLSAMKNTTELSQTDGKDFTKLPQDYPALDITADNFRFNKKNLGKFELTAYPVNDNWDIQKLQLSTEHSTIHAEGQWNNWIRNPNTYLNIKWDIKDLGETFKTFGYPETIKDGAGKLNGTLHWPGSPHQFNTTRLNGELAFTIDKGQILQAKPGVGRLLGLLSLQSLPRRLTLDFRDLFSNGFAFDKINADVKIEQGVMRSDNFTMSGPAADVSIKGETNLQKETQHLYVKVMPRISDSVSLAALAGGPLVGAVAFLAQKILKDPLNKIASSEYEIIGTWDDPQEVKKTEPKNTISPLK
ncbi:MAG: TIGR02099 family protein [Betaproteobacteria bacterium HGW-Betaproteobacteria-22]|nr:MAG: TIGR02099 family protein [Betaproteobacteria bacterium HGW-Betaproteobacteria-22]